jgi:hypothetical protein
MYLDDNLSPQTLVTYQGYSLQVFSSGRIKLSFHRSHNDRVEYYCVRAKRFREAYSRQHTRSYGVLEDHFELVDELLRDRPGPHTQSACEGRQQITPTCY